MIFVAVILKCFNFSRAPRVLPVLPSRAGGQEWNICGVAVITSTSFPVTCFPAAPGLPLDRVNCWKGCWAEDAFVGAMCLLWVPNGIACGFVRRDVDLRRLVVEWWSIA